MNIEMTHEGLYIDGQRVTEQEFKAMCEAHGFTVTNGEDTIKSIVSPDAPTHTNEQGGKQSEVNVRFDLIDARALFEMAKVLDHGAKKYGANNWRLIDIDSHLNHLLMHTYAYLAGDRTDDHLSHILCRATFALGVSLEEPEQDNEQPDDLLYDAWWVIANARDWMLEDKQALEWQKAAEKWRDTFLPNDNKGTDNDRC